jgi:HEAT repeat protein
MLPRQIQKFVPERQSKLELKHRTKAVIYELGPAASRSMVGAIQDCLHRDDSDPLGNEELLLALFWAIPESPKAVEALRNWLIKPGSNRLPLTTRGADTVWSRVPQLAPSLARLLKADNQAIEAAAGLGVMGTNAFFAIPDLIDTYNYGVADSPAKTNSTFRSALYGSPVDDSRFVAQICSRIAAIEALGNLGSASPEVLAVLRRAFTHPREAVRVAAAHAIGKLGSKALPLLPALLNELDVSNRFVLEYQIEAIGNMGPDAREAIPDLLRWCASNVVESVASPKPQGCRDHQPDDPLPLPGGAGVALLKIAPDEAKGFGKFIAEALVPGPQTQGPYCSVDKLRRLQPLADEIVSALEPGLQASPESVRQLTALQILCLESDHTAARNVLLAAMKQSEPSLRAQAAVYLWQATGDTNQVLPVLCETLATVKDNSSQAPVDYAAQLGSAAKPLVPQIQALLANGDWSIRQAAGHALRRIDPTALPLINEGRP